VNAYKDENGWHSYVQVRKLQEPELYEVIDRNPQAIEKYPTTPFGVDRHGRLRPLRPGDEPNKIVHGGRYSTYTRIWMGISPKEGGEPGYCCVVGEVHNGSFEPQQRDFFVLDEGVAVDVDYSLALHPDLFEACCALKDIYMPERIFYDPKHQAFKAELHKNQWGIASYPDEELYPDSKIKEMYPFFVSRERTTAPVECPYSENDEYNFTTVESLLQRRRIQHHACCEVFKGGQYRTPHRALAMVCQALMFWDWNEVLAEQKEYDGYPDPELSEDELDALDEHIENDEVLHWIVLDADNQMLIREHGIDAYYRKHGIDSGVTLLDAASQ